MALHKVRPRLKKYVKFGILKKDTRHVSKTKAFFSPDLNYLNTKFSNKLEQSFNKSISNLRKLKLLFGFYRTALLKKITGKRFLRKSKSRYLLKEVEFCSLLERRLDVLLYRLGLVSSLFEAKQLISHKKVRINNCFVSSYSYSLKKGDIVSFDSSIELMVKRCLIKQLQTRDLYVLRYVEINFKILKIIFLKEKLFLPEQIQHYNSLLKWET